MRLRFHGIGISVEGGARELAAAEELLGGLPAEAGDAAPDLRIVLRPGPAIPRPARPRAFYHGIVDCHVEGDALLVSDGFSRARVEAGGRLLDVVVADESLRDGYLFAHVLLFIALGLALRWRGLFHLHAAALVAPDGGGILVAGHGGSGKSTLTLALLERGCAYLGDDAVFVAPAARGDPVLAWPRPFHVAPATARAFPRVAALLTDHLPAGEKRRLDPAVAWPGLGRATMPAPATLLFPRIAGTPGTSVEQVPAANALGDLIESSTHVIVEGLPAREAHLEALRGLADAAAAFAVGLGLDLLSDPGGVADAVIAATR